MAKSEYSNYQGYVQVNARVLTVDQKCKFEGLYSGVHSVILNVAYAMFPRHPEGRRRRVIIIVTTLTMARVTGQDPIGTLGVSPSRSLDHRIAKLSPVDTP